MHTTHNARIQLLATLLNNAALAFIVAGFIAPIDSLVRQLRSGGVTDPGLGGHGDPVVLQQA